MSDVFKGLKTKFFEQEPREAWSEHEGSILTRSWKGYRTHLPQFMSGTLPLTNLTRIRIEHEGKITTVEGDYPIPGESGGVGGSPGIIPDPIRTTWAIDWEQHEILLWNDPELQKDLNAAGAQWTSTVNGTFTIYVYFKHLCKQLWDAVAGGAFPLGGITVQVLYPETSINFNQPATVLGVDPVDTTSAEERVFRLHDLYPVGTVRRKFFDDMVENGPTKQLNLPVLEKVDTVVRTTAVRASLSNIGRLFDGNALRAAEPTVNQFGYLDVFGRGYRWLKYPPQVSPIERGRLQIITRYLGSDSFSSIKHPLK